MAPSPPLIPVVQRGDDVRLFSEHRIFGTMAPSSRVAVKTFDRIVDAFIAHPALFAKARRFVVLFSPQRRPIAAILGTAHSTSPPPNDAAGYMSFSSDATQPNTPEPEETAWDGAYVFSFDHDLAAPAEGWTLGYGPYRPLDNLADLHGDASLSPHPDIILAFGEERRLRNIHKVSAAINFAPISGAVAIRGTKEFDTLRCDSHYYSRKHGLVAFTSPAVTLAFGDLDFVFQHVHINPDADFQAAKSTFLREKAANTTEINPLAAPTPSTNDIRLGEWTLLAHAGHGAEASVRAAIRQNNDLVAVKTYHRSRASDHRDRIRLYKELRWRINPNNAPHVARLQDVLYSSQEVFSHPDQVYLLLTPLAQCDFKTLLKQWNAKPPPEDGPSDTVRLTFFYQLLSGLESLHMHNFIHDDIKPANLGLLRMHPPHLVILDLDMVKDIARMPSRTMPTAHNDGGTIGYLAPEREGDPASSYGIPVDIWAAGCVGTEFFCGRPLQTRRIGFNPYRDRDTFPLNNQPRSDELQFELDQQAEFLHELSQSPLATKQLLARMLTTEPSARITAFEAQLHDALKGYAPIEEAVEHVGGKRRMENDADGMQSVAGLSKVGRW